MTEKKTKVMVFGTFDIIHKGHIHMLKEAKEYGDILVVVLARNQTIKRIKRRDPLNNEMIRKLNIEKLNIADKVLFGDLKNRYKRIQEEKPDIIALGYDQKAFVDKLAENIDDNTQIVRLAPYNPHLYKTTKILEKMKQEKNNYEKDISSHN